MKAFADLYAALDETTRTGEKVEALVRYFSAARPEDAAWAVYFLTGRRPRQVVPNRLIRAWAVEEAAIPPWLFDECYDAVGDLSETIALLLPEPNQATDEPLAAWVDRLLRLRAQAEDVQREGMLHAWRTLPPRQRFLWNKLISGAFRVGVAQQLVVRALAQASGVEVASIAHRLMGDWSPTPEFYRALVAAEADETDVSRPYPFCLAHALTDPPEALGELADWQAEWKWDGIRAQAVRRAGKAFLWTRGEELVTDRYPELAPILDALPDGTVIDGELMPWKDGPLPFAQLQRRIGRKTLTKTVLADVPVALVAFDLIEDGRTDVRGRPLSWRRTRLGELVAAVAYPEKAFLSPLVAAATWADLAAAQAASRRHGAEGLMLKRLSSPYRGGRRRGDWWKWKVAPYSIDAVLTAAQRGAGKRASLYTDYTFSIWDGPRLVPIAKAYSGLTDAEIRRVDAFIRRNMVEAFGPVRTVKPQLVFELAFEGLQRSPRHKSGVALRFPRIARWREDKGPEEADTIETVRGLLPPDG